MQVNISKCFVPYPPYTGSGWQPSTMDSSPSPTCATTLGRWFWWPTPNTHSSPCNTANHCTSPHTPRTSGPHIDACTQILIHYFPHAEMNMHFLLPLLVNKRQSKTSNTKKTPNVFTPSYWHVTYKHWNGYNVARKKTNNNKPHHRVCSIL